MLRKKIIKISMSIIMIMLLVLGVGQNIVFASDTSKIMNLSKSRYIYDSSTGEYTAGNSYWLNTGSDHPIYQLVEKDDSNEIIGISYYCLSAEAGESWAGTSGNYTNTVTYDTSYDLDEDKSVISELSNSTYSGVINDYYDQIMWILDNMYIAEEDDGTDSNSNGTTDDVEELLEQAGIVYGDSLLYDNLTDWHYNSSTLVWYYGYSGYRVTYNDETLNIVLEPEEIEAIQQAAIWYFTDYKINSNSQYNCYSTDNAEDGLSGTWFDFDEDQTGDTTTDAKIKLMKEEQAQILYNYFIESANSAGTYSSSSSSADVTIAYDNASTTITESESNYVVGPMTITTSGTISSLVVTTGSDYGTTIDSSNITYQDSDGNTITSITAGESFSIVIPTSYVDSGVKVTVTTKATVTTKTLWTSSTAIEQPIVEVEREEITDTASITATIEGEFDLALRKAITAINGVSTDILNESGYDATRAINISTSTIPDTATYYHRKDPVVVETSDVITYEITVYNEGDIAGYASKIVDQLATGLSMASTMGDTVTSSKGNTYSVSYDSSSNQIVFEMTSSSPTSLSAFDGSTLDSDTIEVQCTVTQSAATDGETTYYLTNIAYINEAYDSENGETVAQDRGDESQPSVYPDETASDLNQTSQSSVYSGGTSKSLWNETDNTSDYFAGEEDDDDFETVVVMPKEFDLALRKFITSVSSDGSFDEDTTTTYSRAPEVDTSKLGTTDSDGNTITTAEYNHSKDPVSVSIGDYILYTIRVYNEGEVDGYASEITDYLPEYLDFVDSTDDYISSINGQWIYDSETRTVTTTALADTLLAAFDADNDDGAGSGLSYADVQIICKVNDSALTSTAITNIAEISKYADEDGERETDIDSTADDLDYPDEPSTYQDDEIESGDTYIPGQEDDDDFEKVIIQEFDLALRKFITDVSGEEVTTRIPEVSYDSESGEITYTHTKDVLGVVVGDIVTYTIRVYNEGEIAGYAEEITDDIPDYLEYLPENETNIEYRWVMYDEEGNETEDVDEAVKIVTDYTSKAYGEELMEADSSLTENPNLLNAFDPDSEISDDNPDYVDVKVAFEVLDPDSNTYVIVNKAQISEDADEDGNPIDDIDSIPDEWNDGEDDQDYENVSVEYFDLALLKYVTTVYVTEDGTTTTTKTGNTGADTDIIPKVEISKSKLDSTIVKFEFTIKITNEGDIAGYATEITDYVPEGLEFYEEDNEGWTDEGDNVISTTLLADTLLEPGESATVTVILRWINGSDNLGLKTNVAEISDDYNEKGVPDRDSTPDNQVDGEDDIDDAQVLLAIKTGLLGDAMPYIAGTLVILLVLAGGVVLIKRYVL